MHLHGGIGFTWELGLHVPLRRILRLGASLGTITEHHDALASDILSGDAFRARDLEHDPEKWEPVFGKDHAQTKR